MSKESWEAYCCGVFKDELEYKNIIYNKNEKDTI